LRRAIQREIEDVLSEKILFGEIRRGERVEVDATGEGSTAKFVFLPHSAEPATVLAGGGPIRDEDLPKVD
jgi:ATP-dependent Clp protease ATP-binding subunit ClpC